MHLGDFKAIATRRHSRRYRTHNAGADTGGGGQRGLLTPPKTFSILRSRYSNRTVTLIKQS